MNSLELWLLAGILFLALVFLALCAASLIIARRHPFDDELAGPHAGERPDQWIP